MGEPALFPIVATSEDTYQEVMWKRLDYRLLAQDTLFDAWVTWAEASGDADDKWFAENYSSYVF